MFNVTRLAAALANNTALLQNS
ncbi:MAG: hypothetical protein K0S12_493, partial [Bacteroidetes bacterium]|nr:hypothetical protein [Bacteroidota bacterium]